MDQSFSDFSVYRGMCFIVMDIYETSIICGIYLLNLVVNYSLIFDT